MRLRQNSLVLYKDRPAQIKLVSEKLEIVLADGKKLKVRPKDVTLLHPGPIQSLKDLRPQTGDVETAWELLEGTTTTLTELTELIYEDYTPATAWATWQLVAEEQYFRGTPDAIIVSSAEALAQSQAARTAKAAEKEARAAFLERVRCNQIEPDDKPYLREIEDLALERRTSSQLLRELEQVERPEVAHNLLLKLGYWSQTVNPYPQRLGVPTTSPAISLPTLPDEDRTDFTHLRAFAIDDEGSRDADDAISIEDNRLWVHIADVAALIQPNSPPDLEARTRGASLYLPEGTVTMLPPQATDMLALGLTEVSPALSFGLDLGANGEVTTVEIVPSWIRVQRLSYREAENRLADAPFNQLHTIADSHQAYRRANGSIDITLPEVKLRVEDGDHVTIRPVLPLKSRDLVREAMLMVGEAVARYALAKAIPFPFSSQDAPDKNEVPPGMAGMFALRRTLKRSQVKSVPAPHAGLGLELYSQITSPLRRYADLLAHQQIRAHLKKAPVLSTSQIVEHIATAEAVRGSVRQAERLANKHWTLVYLLAHPGWRGQGVVVEKFNRRCSVLIPELDFEIRLHLRQDLPLDSLVPLELDTVKLPDLEAHFHIAS